MGGEGARIRVEGLTGAPRPTLGHTHTRMCAYMHVCTKHTDVHTLVWMRGQYACNMHTRIHVDTCVHTQAYTSHAHDTSTWHHVHTEMHTETRVCAPLARAGPSELSHVSRPQSDLPAPPDLQVLPPLTSAPHAAL